VGRNKDKEGRGMKGNPYKTMQELLLASKYTPQQAVASDDISC